MRNCRDDRPTWPAGRRPGPVGPDGPGYPAPRGQLLQPGLGLLAELVHSRGYRVALSGEGADEALAGYPCGASSFWHS
ncbi:hypothetical protein DYH09_18840 [bacterium CPR1]|nr:hypothetical protein [bacterium CPR1]